MSASTSTAHAHKDRPASYRILPGKQYGRLTVTKRLGRDPKHPTLYRFECACSCGNTVNVTGGSLATGATRSCGCLRRERCMRWVEGLHEQRIAAAKEFTAVALEASTDPARPVERSTAPGAGTSSRSPKRSPGNNESAGRTTKARRGPGVIENLPVLVGHQGKRSSTEHAVSAANPRTGTT